jgi:hypothetical protein
MTSTDFSFPQPTDDELAAQQPRVLGPHPSLIDSSPDTGFDSHDGAPRPSSATTSAGGAGMFAAGGAGMSSASSTATPSAGDTAGALGRQAAEAKSPALGKAAMALSIVALVLSVAASAILGATVGPAEAASGYYFTDTPDWYQTLAAVLVGLQVLCTCLGITGLILGITAAVTARGRTVSIVAIAVAAVAPFVSFGTFIALIFAFA